MSRVCEASSRKRRQPACMETPMSSIHSWEVCCWKWTTTGWEGSRLAHHLSVERLRGKIKCGKWHRLMKDGASFFGLATSPKKQNEGSGWTTTRRNRDWRSWVDMTRFSQERTERHETPTRTMSRQERTSHRRGNLCTSSRGSFSFLDCKSLSTRRSWERFHIARINLTSHREKLVGHQLVSEVTPTNRRSGRPPQDASVPHLCLTLLLIWTDLTDRHREDLG